MNHELPNQFCPASCGFNNDEFQQARIEGTAYDVCSRDCYHKDDKVYEHPLPVIVYKYGQPKYGTVQATALGENRGRFYLEEDGATGLVSKEAPWIVSVGSNS